MTSEEHTAYTRKVDSIIKSANKPHEATIKLLKDYYKVKPNEVKAAILTIRDAIEWDINKKGLIK